MDTTHLYEFLILSKILNFSRAAEILYLSQPVLSRHIRLLERELQVPLFDRSTHGIQLTEAGLLLAGKAEDLIAQANQVRTASALSQGAPQETLKIGCVLELSYTDLVKQCIHQFRQRYPTVKLSVDILTNGTSKALIQANQYDILFTPCEFIGPEAQLKGYFMANHPVQVAVYPGHRLLTKNLLFIKDLVGEQILVPFAHELFGPYAKNWQIIEKYTHQKVTHVGMLNLATALFEASVGKGLVIVPAFIKSMTPSNLKFIELSSHYCQYNTYIYRQVAGQAPTKLFFEFCKQMAQQRNASFY